ncbi:hypothetical protein [Paenibacillus sp. Z6-24]
MIETIMDALGLGSPEVIGYDQLKVKCPYPLQHIHGLEIQWKPGEHARLQLTGWMDEDIQMQMPLAASVQDEIEITYGSYGAEQPLFRGLVNKVEAIRQNNRHEIIIEGISASSLWDIQKRKRTFPEQTQTYEELIGKINTDYPGSSVAFHTGGDQQVGEAILQYEETDWALTKRLASRLQTVIVCDMLKSVKPRLHFGLPEGKQVYVPDNVPYTARKDLKAYQQAGGSAAGLHDTDFFRYELQHIEPFEIGDRVTFRDKKLVVREVHAVMEKGQLLFNYVLSREHGVRSLLITNPKAIGVSLEGTVLAVRGEEVKLKLDVDKDDGKADPHWYPFAPPTGSPMYSMPQVGTKATLYHPDGTGTRAQIIGSVRTNGASAPKTSDPNIRYYGSEHGSELKMAPDHVHIHGNPAGTMAISLEDGVGVTIRSPKKLTITGKEDIVLFSKKKVIIQAGEQIMAYKTGGTSGISIEGEYHLLGENVWADGSDRTAYAAYQDEPQKGTPPPPPDPPKPFDWGKLGRNVLGGLAIVVGVAALAAFTVATLGAGPVIVGAVAAGAAIAGTAAVGAQAVSDIARGEVSDFGEYATTALRESFIGAVSGAIFGPLAPAATLLGRMGAGGVIASAEDIASQLLQGKKIDWNQVALSGQIGFLTAGLLDAKVLGAVGKGLKSGGSKVANGVKGAGSKVADGLAGTSQWIKNGATKAGEAASRSISKLKSTGSKLGTKIENLSTYANRKNYEFEIKRVPQLQMAGGPDVGFPSYSMSISKEGNEPLIRFGNKGTPSTEGTGKPPNRIYDENGNPLPFGFSSVKQYNDFVKSLKEELPEGTQIIFQGSSVTGVSHKKGLPFDQGRKSDFDIALVNDDLFLEALEIGRGGGFKMKTDPNRIGPLDEKQLDRLGLLEIIEKKSKEAGRPVSFMLYESVEQALKRPSLMVTP